MGHFAYRATSPEALQRRVAVIERVGPRQRLDRRRPRARAGLRLHHARRPRHGDLLRDRMVQAAAGAGARPQEPGAALSRPRRQRPPARPHEPAHVGRRRAPAFPGGRAGPADHRADRARQRPGGGRLGHQQQQDLRPRLHRSTTTAPRAASTTSPTRSTSREEILRAADIFLEAGVPIETGPHKHAIQQTFFLYVYEPGGNRVEVANAGARLMLAPDWQPIVWTEAERKKGQAWGLKTDRELPHPRHAADELHRTAQEVRSPLPMLLQHGERVRVRGRIACSSVSLPLTPTLSPQAGRGGGSRIVMPKPPSSSAPFGRLRLAAPAGAIALHARRGLRHARRLSLLRRARRSRRSCGGRRALR